MPNNRLLHWLTYLLQEALGHLLRQNPATANKAREISTRTPLQDQINILSIPLIKKENSAPQGTIQGKTRSVAFILIHIYFMALVQIDRGTWLWNTGHSFRYFIRFFLLLLLLQTHPLYRQKCWPGSLWVELYEGDVQSWGFQSLWAGFLWMPCWESSFQPPSLPLPLCCPPAMWKWRPKLQFHFQF